MYKNFTLIIIIIILFSSCYKYPDLEEYDYDSFRRVVGAEGGTINFLANYENDSIQDILIQLDIPEGALDSVVVFNMYKTGNYELATEMDNGLAKVGTEFIYFVPFYESQGYHEHDQIDVSYHLSIEFNQPVSVTYNYLIGLDNFDGNSIDNVKLYYEYYKATNNSFQLYRIKIPKTDEWGQENNIRINWNSQGYPVGYNTTDINYIITGSWSQANVWGSELRSLENWEQVTDIDLNGTDGTVSFQINNTDYMYVLAKKTQLELSELPNKVRNFLANNYPDVFVSRAAFNSGDIEVYLSNGVLVVFDKKGNVLRIERNDIDYSEIPDEIDKVKIYELIQTIYPNETIKIINYIQYGFVDPDYYLQIIMSSEITGIFNQHGELMGMYHYGIDIDQIPEDINEYVSTNHEGTNIINVSFDSMDGLDKYIIYLSDNTKIYFKINGEWVVTLYNNVPLTDLPEGIQTKLDTDFPNISVAYSVKVVDASGESYRIILLNATQIIFDTDATVTEMVRYYLDESELPQAITTAIEAKYSEIPISEINYYFNSDEEIYDIYFIGNLNIEFTIDGAISYLYGTKSSLLATVVQNYLNINYPNDIVQEYEMFVDDEIYNQKVLYVLLKSGTYVIFDENGNFIENYFSLNKLEKHKKDYKISDF